MPYQLLKTAYEHGIVVEYLDMQSSIEAFYFNRPECPPVIGLSKRIFKNIAHYRTVLAHELGHHFTSAQSTVIHAYFKFADRIEIGRDEYRAMAWAAKYLMPTREITKALHAGINSIWEMAEYFRVDEELVKLRLMLYFK